MHNLTTEVLLIEDDLSQATLITKMLSEGPQAFSIRHVQHLTEGLTLLQSRKFDVILVDLGPLDSRGVEAVLTLRNQAKLTPIVALLAPGREDAPLESLLTDVQDYLSKNEISSGLLLHSIRYAIQHKRADESLRGCEERFASFLQHLPAAAWVKDAHGRYVHANDEAERIFLKTSTELLGRTDAELFPPETAHHFVENDGRVIAEGVSLQTIEVLRQADGIEHHSLVTKFALPGSDGRPAYVGGIAFDITEQKRAEDALKKSERKLSMIFHAAPALISISTRKDGKIVDINETALQTLGYRRDEVIGRTGRDINFWVDSSDRGNALQKLAEHGSVRNYEMRFRGKNGQIFAGLFSAEVIDIDGERCMLTLIKDITSRKQAEEEIERLNTELAARASELEEANRELEAFNYTVAHDLRKPLTAINGYCHFIRELCEGYLDDQCKKYLKEAYDGTWRMNQLIDTLLKFSRTTRMELRREPVDLSAMAQEVAAGLKVAETDRRATFLIMEGMSVIGDPVLLRVVLENLFGNAWKYTAIREEAVIEFGETKLDGQPTWFVRDNGPGFAMTDAKLLFIPFQRLPGTEKEAGFGIGLATVERIIRRHGGLVWAEGEPGKGAAFYFTLGNGPE